MFIRDKARFDHDCLAAFEIFKLFMAFGGFVLVAATLLFEIRHHFAMPAYDDVFDRVRYYAARGNQDRMIDYLLSAHNEHRITTTRILAIIDEYCFQGREYVQVICANLFQIASACICLHVFFRGTEEKVPLNQYVFYFSPVLLLFINPNFLYTLIYPFQVQHAIMALLCVATAERVALASTWQGGPLYSNGRFWLPLLGMAVIASFTLGNGPILLLATATAAIILHWRSRTTVLLALLGVTHLVVVLKTTSAVGEGSHNIIQILKFAAMYWGAPFTRFDAWPGGFLTTSNHSHLTVLAGIFVFAFSILFGLARLKRPGLGGQAAAFGLVLLIIVVATGLAAGHSRSQFGIMEGGNKKYASFAALGWVGILAVLTGLMSETKQHVGRFRDWLYIVALAALLPATAAAYQRETDIWQKFSERNWEASIAAAFKINAHDPLSNISQSAAELGSYLTSSEALGVGAYAQIPYKWGQDSQLLLSDYTEVSCRGSAEHVNIVARNDQEKVFDVEGTPASISGWSWMDKDFKPASQILALTPDHHIVGYALTTRTGDIAEEWLGQKFMVNVGWFGYVRARDLSSLTFLALSPSSHTYCKLGAVGQAR